MPNRVAVIQSNYIPWAGYFAVMAAVDVFVVYECVQYTKNDWRNRNQIQSDDGTPTWLTIPVRHLNLEQAFMDTRIASGNWAMKHYNTLRHHFSRKPGWRARDAEILALYEQARNMDFLHEVNRLFMDWAIEATGIQSKVVYLSAYPEHPSPTARLISILKDFDTRHYLSGPAAKDYLDPRAFDAAGIELEYVNYDELIPKFLTGPKPAGNTSIMQLILEGNYEFRCD